MSQIGRERDSLEICAADAEPGIAPEITGCLFEPFATKARKVSRLGLPAVRNLVRAHGGDSRLEPMAPGPGFLQSWFSLMQILGE